MVCSFGPRVSSISVNVRVNFFVFGESGPAIVMFINSPLHVRDHSVIVGKCLHGCMEFSFHLGKSLGLLSTRVLHSEETRGQITQSILEVFIESYNCPSCFSPASLSLAMPVVHLVLTCGSGISYEVALLESEIHEASGMV